MEVLRSDQLAAVGQLAAGVGHELRNPLTSIKMIVQSALEDPRPQLNEDDLKIIDDEIRRMQHSLQTFLDLSRPMSVQRRPIVLRPLMENVRGLVKSRAEKQNVNLWIDVADELTVVADEGQLRQVLVNLSLNALDAMPTGGTIEFSARRQKPDLVRIEVRDSGPGIGAAMMAKLFEPFASTKETGLGLGLVNSKRIVEAHGGMIAAANRLEGGASFTLTLPAEASHADSPGGG
jgi:signal transduction histidine kinase